MCRLCAGCTPPRPSAPGSSKAPAVPLSLTGARLGTMTPDAAHYVENAPMNLLQEQDATCPHCWETISLTLDLSVPEQSYVEDCPVCCKPMLVSYTTADGEIAEFSVESAE
jgi:hypothetical protein